MRAWLVVCCLSALFIAWAVLTADAAHCRYGQIYRVSMHRCVSDRSKLGREIVWPRRSLRYGRSNDDEPKPKRRSAKAKPERWFVDILLPDDGSLNLGDATPRSETPKTEAPQTPREEPEQPELQKWPENWLRWHMPHPLTGP